MLTFSQDPQVAETQMQAIIFSLTTFGHIDGDFDEAEKDFVRGYIQKLVTHRVATGMPLASAAERRDVAARFTEHFLEIFENIERWVAEVMSEPVGEEEDPEEVAQAKLKLRCFELFAQFDSRTREALLETLDEFIVADGHTHPAETKFRAELARLLDEDVSVTLDALDDDARPSVRLNDSVTIPAEKVSHPFFAPFEHHYSRDPSRLQKQVSADLALLDRVLETLAAQRAAGAGRLDGVQSIAELAGQTPFLDEHVYVAPTRPDRTYELLVLGDLHGCYSCLKAAIMQTRFFDKVEAFRRDPASNPEPKLVLLGDYIDRGIFSLNGVFRAAMQLFVTAPEHVVMLRGNHEYYVEHKGNIYGGVRPAEAINSLKPHLPIDVFRRYMTLFNAMPNMLIFGKTLFVHGGIPRDRIVKERWKGLATLNDRDIRFQMMWSDPSIADVVPVGLQDQTARFPFGRLQLQAFLQRLGCNTLIRGHEKINAGFARVYADPNATLMTVFSAGGADNRDLPPGSAYRSVTPKALWMRHRDGETEITPFDLDWRAYNDPEHNAFFRSDLEIEHRVE